MFSFFALSLSALMIKMMFRKNNVLGKGFKEHKRCDED
jgi:hypothetical protein